LHRRDVRVRSPAAHSQRRFAHSSAVSAEGRSAIIGGVTLHVLNGDSTRFSLARSTVSGEFTVWADALHEGPVPAGVSDEHLLEMRAEHFAAEGGIPADSLLAMVRGWHAGLARATEFEEVVFWLEHDLFDQLILLRHLHWLSTTEAPRTTFSLICIGSFPGVLPFHGLGQLTPEQLASLLPQRTAVTSEQLALGRDGWSRFREPDPLPLVEWAARDYPALRFVAGALQRHFEDYPSVATGLSRSERQILAALRSGEQTFSELFIACQRMEERVYMGDSIFWSIVRRLAYGRNPLVTVTGVSGAAITPSIRVASTTLGEVVLDGGADYVELNGIDRWMGGVHLTTSRLWRWDDEAQAMVLAEH
jgi:hypothetical protein